jgi:ribosomal protein S18 acetylase RimI-like enzyme
MVDPDFQGQGIARRMMRFAEGAARNLGCGVMRLDAFALNPQALRLYRSLEYRDAGEVRFRKGAFRCFEKRLASVT